MFQALDGPPQRILERLRLFEIEGFKLSAKRLHVDGRCDRTRLHTLERRVQLDRQPVADPPALRLIRK